MAVERYETEKSDSVVQSIRLSSLTLRLGGDLKNEADCEAGRAADEPKQRRVGGLRDSHWSLRDRHQSRSRHHTYADGDFTPPPDPA
jgi:hypothetical protein